MGRRNNAEARRKEIVSEYYELAREVGLENSSIANIASRMGMRKSHITYYFPSKDDLILSLVDYVLKRYTDTIIVSWNYIPDPVERLKAMLDSMFTTDWKDRMDGRVFFACYYLTFDNERIKKRFVDLYNHFKEELLYVIKEIPIKKEYSIEPEVIVGVIIAFLEGADYISNIYSGQKYIERLSCPVRKMLLSLFSEMKE